MTSVSEGDPHSDNPHTAWASISECLFILFIEEIFDPRIELRILRDPVGAAEINENIGIEIDAA